MINYILDENNDVVEATQEQWLDFMRAPFEATMRVAQDRFEKYSVSTVFLSIDHSFGEGPPVLFETMVFSKDDPAIDLYCERYCTREKAVLGA